MMATRMLALLVFTLACGACRVGEPLVDVVDAGLGIPQITCNLPPECTPVERGEAQQLAAIPVGVACEQICIWQTSGGNTEDCLPSILDRLPSTARCMFIELQPPVGTSELRVNSVDWQDLNVPVRAQQPLTLVLHGGSLARVYFELEGPVTLRMEALQQLEDLRFIGRPNAKGSPRVEITAERSNELSAGSKQQLFPGEIRLTAGIYENIDVHAEAFAAESVLMQGARLHATMSTLTDVTLERAWVDTKHALWSAFVANDATLRFCGEARLVTGQMARCAATSCEGSSVRMYDDSFVSGSLDGDYEMSDTNVENVQLGPQAASQVFAYDTTLTSVTLCVNMQQLVFGTGSRISCSACAEALVANLPVCAVEEPTEKWLQNYCAGWDDADPLPLCSEDTPIRAQRAR